GLDASYNFRKIRPTPQFRGSGLFPNGIPGNGTGRATVAPGSSALLLRQDAHGALVGAGSEGGISLERGRHIALAGGCGLPAELVLLGAAGRQFLVGNGKIDGAVRNIDFDQVALTDEADRAALGGFRRGMADRQAGGAARKAPVGDERAGGPE